MKLSKAATLVWENRATLRFGSRKHWDEDSFLESWVNHESEGLWHNKEGVYWFSSSVTCDKLLEYQKPHDLPDSGCNFSELAQINSSLLSGNLCHDYGLPILYNGQRSQVFSRLRAHFKISDGTGALGIHKYPLSAFEWSASVFHVGMVKTIPGLTETERDYLTDLLCSETGRHAIEAAWRSEYGWPLLCKK
ncbi:hypothetical protein ACMXYW_04670 [Neptuniibacter sp. QD48_55]|uniref:hypothetical protein n=1 Tax=Neptuniibacter sp. QD48_55 TaxID=3398212 RepID=UPI0039F481A3